MQPLTHHEILELVEPLTRVGRHVDLAASDRIARRLAFRPVEHAPLADGTPGCSESLQLESLAPQRLRLTRTLTCAQPAVQATLQGEGSALQALWARIDAVPPRRQLQVAPGRAVAQNHRLDGGAAEVAAGAGELVFLGGVAQLDGLTLTLRASMVRGYSADLELVAPAHDTIELPEDLLGVLGWDWGLLARRAEGWSSKVRVRGKEPQRSRRAEAALARVADHLSQTLSRPPRSFHQRWVWARWVFALRRAMPLLFCAALVAAAAAVPKLPIAPDSVVRMLIFNAPPLLLVLCFALQELPRFEIPPIPRPSPQPAWRLPPRAG
jgi:hypothetical protein